MVDLRFVPDQVSALWTRLFDIATYRSYVHTEGVAPDLRPLALVVLGVASLAVGGIRARAWRSSSRAALASETAPLVVFVVGGYVPWLLASGNSRYLIPAFALVGLLLVKAAETAMPRRLAHSLLGVLLLLQCAYFVHGDDHRYQPKPWDSRPYLDVEVPSRLQQQPFLHLSIGTPSFAGLAPSIARDGAFINIMGPLSLPTTGPLGSALRQRLDAWQGRTRLLMQAREGRGTLADEQRFRQRIDRIVYRFGLNVDWIDCLDIQIHLDPPAAPSRAGKAGAPVRLRSCGSVTRTLVDPTYEAAAAAAESVFGTVEAQCPLIFGPRPMAIDGDLDAWQRRYLNSNARLTLSDQDGLLLTHFRSAQVVSLGSANDILAGRGKNACVAWNELKVQ